jgi:serine/threonine protein phosphatase 1
MEIVDWYTGRVLLGGVGPGANLRGASLRFADLRGADLRHANLEGADLRGALLWNTDLCGARLDHALLGFFEGVEGRYRPGDDLTGANFWNAVYDAATRWPAGSSPHRLGAIEAAHAPTAPPVPAAGFRTFAVGDVHGQAEKLRALLALLHAHAAPGDALVFLGDLIDRGPDSRDVLEVVLAEAQGNWPGPVHALRGNHEAMLLDALDGDPEVVRAGWLQYGGLDTLDSYGGEEWALENWSAHLPPAHLDFFRSLGLWHQDQHGIYVHAGLRPGRQPHETGEETLLWVREKFYASDYRWEKVVVFGHSPRAEPPDGPEAAPRWRPMNRPEKIGLDTGAGHGGPLTAVVLPARDFFLVR